MCSKDFIIFRETNRVNVGIPMPVNSEYLSHLSELCKEFSGQREIFSALDSVQIIIDIVYEFYTFKFDYNEAADGFYYSILLE